MGQNKPSYNTVVKIGIVGLGFMGATHLNAYSKVPGVEVRGVCTRNEQALSGDLSHVGGNLKQAASTYDFSHMRRWVNWEEMMLDPEIDAVDICLPTDMHTEVALAALEAGKHVYCEKPMALHLADCDRMVRMADEQKRVLMIAQVLRFWPEYERLRDFVRNGNTGAIREARFSRSCGLPAWSRWLPVETRSGGAVLDLLVHDIDQILLLFGMPESLVAKANGEVDTIDARLRYSGGLEIQLEGGWLPAEKPFQMSFSVQSERTAIELTPDGLFEGKEADRQKVDVGDGNAYESEIAYFVDCCQKGTRPERCLPEDSAAAVKLALLLKESRARGGEQIKCLV